MVIVVDDCLLGEKYLLCNVLYVVLGFFCNSYD